MDELRKQLIAAGMPDTVVNAMDDAALQAFAQSCAKFATATPTETAPVPADGSTTAVNGDMTGSNEKPGNAVQTNEGTKAPENIAKLSDDVTKRVLLALGVQGKEGERAAARIKEIDANTTKRLFSDKATSLIKSGIISPSVNEGGLIESIALDIAGGTTGLRKFGDKELSLESRFGLLLDRLAEQKPVKLGERAQNKDPKTFSDAEKSDEVEKVKSHYRKHSDGFRSAGVTEESRVKAFEIMQKDRGMTAEEFTGEAA